MSTDNTPLTPERIAYLLEVDIETARAMAEAKNLLAALEELIMEIDTKKLKAWFATEWRARAAIAKAKVES